MQTGAHGSAQPSGAAGSVEEAVTKLRSLLLQAISQHWYGEVGVTVRIENGQLRLLREQRDVTWQFKAV